MTLMPFISTWSGRSAPVPSAMAASSRVHDGFALCPVDRYVGAVDEAGQRRGQERDQRRDLLRLADAGEPDGTLGQFARAILGHALVAGEGLLQGVPPVGVHRAGVDRVDAHPVPAVLFGDRG